MAGCVFRFPTYTASTAHHPFPLLRSLLAVAVAYTWRRSEGKASGGFISPLFLLFLLSSIFICPSFPFLSNLGVGNDGMPDAGDMLSIFIACVLSALLLLCCFIRVGNGGAGLERVRVAWEGME